MSLVNLISKDANLVFYLSVYIKPAIMTYLSVFVSILRHSIRATMQLILEVTDKGHYQTCGSFMLFLSCFYGFVRVCLLMPCGHLLGKG